MRHLRRRPDFRPAFLWLPFTLLLTTGCASPGSPRPPSLQLPQVVTDLAAVRSGDSVEVRFTVPTHTTDGQRIREPFLHGSLCRQDTPGAACAPTDLSQTATSIPVPADNVAQQQVIWTDKLPSALASGMARPIQYRVELRNAEGRSAGPSNSVYTAAGVAPPPVERFEAEGARPGVLLHWAPTQQGAGEVLLARQQLDAKPAKTPASAPEISSPGLHGKPRRHASEMMRPHSTETSLPDSVLFEAEPGNAANTRIIDGTAIEGVRYQYNAFRRELVRVGGRTLELRSVSTPPVAITWRDVFPPAPPQNLTALGYATGPASGTDSTTARPVAYAVDLIWQPVNDPRVIGYAVTRFDLSTPGQRPERLTAEPVTTPAFHDTTALPGTSYRYEVTAVDAKGNVSQAATAVVQAVPR